jgi:hypothetical protein
MGKKMMYKIVGAELVTDDGRIIGRYTHQLGWQRAKGAKTKSEFNRALKCAIESTKGTYAQI